MAKGRFNRSKGSFRRGRAPQRNSGDVFLIVTEGEVTEPEYFRAIVSALRMSTIDVEVAHSTTGTDPLSVVAHADKLNNARNRAVKKGDPTLVKYNQVWVVFDQEGLNNGRDWQNAIHQAKAKGFKIVFSNPSFEFWLLLHHEYTTASFTDCSAVERRLRSQIGSYTKQRGKTDYPGLYIPKTECAIINARQVREDHDRTGETNPYTDADKLIVELNGQAKINQIFKHRKEWADDKI